MRTLLVILCLALLWVMFLVGRADYSATLGPPQGIAARGELRHQFCHASDLVPTLLDVVGVKPPKVINGVKQMPLEGTSFASFANLTGQPATSDAFILGTAGSGLHARATSTRHGHAPAGPRTGSCVPCCCDIPRL